MNKNLLLTGVLSFLATATISAQNLETPKLISPISKGHITVGSNIGVGNLAADNSSDRTRVGYGLSLNPSAGYFLTNHWLLSGEILSSASGTFGERRFYTRSAGIGLSARYYFGKPNDSKGNINRFRFYAEAGGSYERRWLRAEDLNGPVRQSGNLGLLKAGLGFNYLLNDNVAFETGLSGRRYMYGSKDLTTSEMSLQLELGVRIFLNRR